MKKGQVTVFIIIGIVVLFSIAIASYLYNKQSKQEVETRKPFDIVDSEEVTRFVQSCLEKVSYEGIYKLAAQGGYIAPRGELSYGEEGDFLPVHYFFGSVVLPYSVNNDTSTIRPLSSMTSALNRYVAVEFPKCLDFKPVEEKGFTVTAPQIDWEANGFNFNNASVSYSAEMVRIVSMPRLDAGDVAITATYPILFEKEGQSFKVTDFFVTIPLRLALLHKVALKVANEFTSKASKNVYKLSENCANFASSDKLVNVYATPNRFARDFAVTVVDAKPTTIGLAPLKFNFAARNIQLLRGNCVG